MVNINKFDIAPLIFFIKIKIVSVWCVCVQDSMVNCLLIPHLTCHYLKLNKNVIFSVQHLLLWINILNAKFNYQYYIKCYIYYSI